MGNKLKQQKAETLVETLVALLIVTMSVMMLTAAITGAAKVNKQNADAQKVYVQDLEKAESYEGMGNGTLEIYIHSLDNSWYFKGEGVLYGGDGEFASYK